MKYRKKPVVIEAFQLGFEKTPSWYIGKGVWGDNGETWETIETLEGNMRAEFGDFIIKGIKGEQYPCKPDIFDATYEAVEGPHRDQAAEVDQ